MIGQAFVEKMSHHRGPRMDTRAHVGSRRRLDTDAVSLLHRTDIFGAVWSGELSTTLSARSTDANGQVTIQVVNVLKHAALGTVGSSDLLAAINVEQARTLFLCNLSFVQEKLCEMSRADSAVRFNVPVNAAALATLGGELRVIAQHTSDLFNRIQLTYSEDEISALSSDQIAQIRGFEAFGLRLDIRRSLH